VSGAASLGAETFTAAELASRANTDARPLTDLREELQLFEAAPHADGSPGWSLHDPVRNQFFGSTEQLEILARWRLGDAQAIADAVSAETTLDMCAEDVGAVHAFLLENQLCQMQGQAGTENLLRREQARHSTVWQWLLHHYLFFRLPLVRPDRWLSRHVDAVAPLFSRRFFLITGFALLLGLFQCFRQWSHFSATSGYLQPEGRHGPCAGPSFRQGAA
jgi:putative peptide zinc metalloprotease protein